MMLSEESGSSNWESSRLKWGINLFSTFTRQTSPTSLPRTVRSQTGRSTRTRCHRYHRPKDSIGDTPQEIEVSGHHQRDWEEGQEGDYNICGLRNTKNGRRELGLYELSGRTYVSTGEYLVRGKVCLKEFIHLVSPIEDEFQEVPEKWYESYVKFEEWPHVSW